MSLTDTEWLLYFILPMALTWFVTQWAFKEHEKTYKRELGEELRRCRAERDDAQEANETLISDNDALKEQLERLDQKVWDLKEDIFFLKHDLTDAQEALRKAKGDG